MWRTIHAIFENGVFRPADKVNLREHEKVELVVRTDTETAGLAQVAENSGAFDYLSEPEEDIYNITDGQPV